MKATFTTALVVAALCPTIHAKDPSAVVPLRFSASIEEWKGASYRAQLAPDGTIEYSDNLSPDRRPIHIRVSLKRWMAFRRRLDAGRVWSWQRKYIDSAVADGTTWSLQIVYSDRRIVSSGFNAYPSQKQFDEFRAAVRELTGGKPFE